MMLKRPSHTLVASTVAIAIRKPITRPSCTLDHVNAKCSTSRELVGPLSRRRGRERHDQTPEPEPGERSRTDDASA